MQLIIEQTNLKNSFSSLYYSTANQIQKYISRDSACALKIQSKYRMHTKRKQYLKKKQSAIRIQTFFRSWHARKQYKFKKILEDNRKNLVYFSQQAVTIQKNFRGYFVRKCVHDFYLRKQELKAMDRKNNQFKKQLDQYGRIQALQADSYRKLQAKLQFQSLAKNLHHLTSTRNIPGVYNSPFVVEKPAVFDKTVEEHLKGEFKMSYRWKPPTRGDILKYSIRQQGKTIK